MGALEEGSAAPRSIVCGVDGTDESRDAALVAATLAHALDARLILAYVAYGSPAGLRQEDAIATCTTSLVALAGALGLDDAVLRVAFGDPAARLLALCEEDQAALLVVGSRGRSALATALIDAAATRDDGWRVPVIVVPRHSRQPLVPATLDRVAALPSGRSCAASSGPSSSRERMPSLR